MSVTASCCESARPAASSVPHPSGFHRRPRRGEVTLEPGRVGLRDGDARLVPDRFGGTGKAGGALGVAQVGGDAGGQLQRGGHELQVARSCDVGEDGHQQAVRLLAPAR